MKKLVCTLAMVSLAAFSFAAKPIKNVSGTIGKNTTWDSDTVYVLNGFVYVDSTKTLTIEAGTVIRGDKASKGSLIVQRGAKIMAEGTAANPIVFTSNQAAGSRAAGDWGGLIILGKAPVNQGSNVNIEGSVNRMYGGNDAADNSGILKYVRIEYAGIAFSANNEINGLTMGGVGNGTTIDYVQVIFSGDDSFEWFGGTVNCKHLVAAYGVDDDFDTDFGFGGRIQFGVVVRKSNIADQAGDSNGFESDNDAAGSTKTAITAPIFSNVSVFGPIQEVGGSFDPKFNNALRLRRNTATSTFNSVFSGFPYGLYLEDSAVSANVAEGELKFKYNVLAMMKNTALRFKGKKNGVDSAAFMTNNGCEVKATLAELKAGSPYTANPNFALEASSELLIGANFTDAKISGESFFDKAVTYRGAFGAIDWTDNWTNFDPQNTNYEGTVGINMVTVVNGINVYPNPVADAATINFNVVKAGQYTVNVYDITGKLVVNAASTYFTEGVHNVALSTDNLNNGIYMVKFEGAEGVASTKIEVVR